MYGGAATTVKNDYWSLLVETSPPALVVCWIPEASQTQQTVPPAYEQADTMDVSTKREPPWFYSDEWQAMEDEADEDHRAGRLQSYDSVDELLASL